MAQYGEAGKKGGVIHPITVKGIREMTRILRAHIFSKKARKEIKETITLEETKKISGIDKSDMKFINHLESLWEKEESNAKAVRDFIVGLYDNDPAIYKKYRQAFLKDKLFLTKSLYLITTSKPLDTKRLRDLQGSFLTTLSILKIFAAHHIILTQAKQRTPALAESMFDPQDLLS